VPEDWSRAEVQVIAADYFDMWSKELARERVNKASTIARCNRS
jgi:hypothetical protein